MLSVLARDPRRLAFEALPAPVAEACDMPAVIVREVATGRFYVPLALLAGVTGLSRHLLHHYRRPLAWGVPGDWRLVRGETFYGVHRLAELADVLADWGEVAEAGRLRAFLRGLTGAVDRADGPPRNWMAEWEGRQS